MAETAPSPRLRCIQAADAPFVLVFRRGPSEWCRILRWRVDEGVLENGAWVKKHVHPDRCDFSADGQLMAFYLAGGFGPAYRVFAGVSRAPWLFPLASWDERDSFGRGYCLDVGAAHTWGDEIHKSGVDDRVFRLKRNEAVSFVHERRRGWREALDCAPRGADDLWDENRDVVIVKKVGNGGWKLRRGRSQGAKGEWVEIENGKGQRTRIVEAVWADWDHRGRLLMATDSGELIVKEWLSGNWCVTQRHETASMVPRPVEAPAWARSIEGLRGR